MKSDNPAKPGFIGITGYPLPMLKTAAERKRVDVILSYCHCNLLATDLNADLAPFAERNGISLISASPLHMGLSSESPAPSWHPASATVRDAARNVVALGRRRGLTPGVVARSYSQKGPHYKFPGNEQAVHRLWRQWYYWDPKLKRRAGQNQLKTRSYRLPTPPLLL